MKLSILNKKKNNHKPNLQYVNQGVILLLLVVRADDPWRKGGCSLLPCPASLCSLEKMSPCSLKKLLFYVDLCSKTKSPPASFFSPIYMATLPFKIRMWWSLQYGKHDCQYGIMILSPKKKKNIPCNLDISSLKIPFSINSPIHTHKAFCSENHDFSISLPTTPLCMEYFVSFFNAFGHMESALHGG